MLKKGLFLILMLFAMTVYGETKPMKEAIFAGGCFWCTQADFAKLPGVVKTIAGYDGGTIPNPSYEDVSTGKTGYAECIKVIYDPAKISYPVMVNYFLHHIDPTTKDAQFTDVGKQYRTAIFYLDKKQKESALTALSMVKKQLPHVYTEVVPSTHFYPAENYHQDYYIKNPLAYNFYRWNSGHDQRVKDVWSTARNADSPYVNVDKKDKLKELTALQYEVTQKAGTEKPFKNAYWNNKEPGIYVDVVSGEPLFASIDKYDSGTGWPSFTKPLESQNIVTKEDRKLFFLKRIEVRSKYADSHLGHVFDDGPASTGKRYCMNSASLRFIPADKLNEEGYGKYDYLFPKKS